MYKRQGYDRAAASVNILTSEIFYMREPRERPIGSRGAADDGRVRPLLARQGPVAAESRTSRLRHDQRSGAAECDKRGNAGDD